MCAESAKANPSSKSTKSKPNAMAASPKKKLRTRSSVPPSDDPPVDAVPDATPPEVVDVPDEPAEKTVTNFESDGESPAPRLVAADMEAYRRACLSLERQRHEKVYQAEKHFLQEQASIEAQHAAERRAAEEDYAAAVAAVKERYLAENMEKTRRIEERLYGLPRRHAENGRPRRANGHTDVEPRTSRRGRAARDAAANTKAVAAPPGFQVALDDAAIDEDLAKICGKRNRRSPDNDTPALPERRAKKRK